MVEDELLGYDDTASVAFIRNYIPQELKELLSDDDIVYIVDLIYDYYESRGYLSDEDQDGDEPIDIDEDELLEYVVRNAKKDGVGKFDRANSSTARAFTSLTKYRWVRISWRSSPRWRPSPTCSNILLLVSSRSPSH